MKILWKILFGTILLITIFYQSISMAVVSDHVFKIEMSTTYDHGFPGDPVNYEFDAWMQVDQTVVAGTLQIPNGSTYPLVFEQDDEGRWLGYYFESSNVEDLNDFSEGTYTFNIEYADSNTDSTSVAYSLANGDPIPPVTQAQAFIYPLHNTSNVPLALSFQFDPAEDPNWDISLYWEPANEVNEPFLAGQAERLAYSTSSYGPVVLSPGLTYVVESVINRAYRSKNDDKILTVVDKDAESRIYFSSTSAALHAFRKVPDSNFDGKVDFADVAILASKWLQRPDEQ